MHQIQTLSLQVACNTYFMLCVMHVKKSLICDATYFIQIAAACCPARMVQ